MTTRRIPVIVALALSLAVGWLGATVQPTAAASDYTQTAATTYVVDPNHGRLDVTVTVKLKNLKPNLVTSTTVTRYYLDKTSIWIENEASAVTATSGGASLKVKLGAMTTYYRPVTVSFPNLYYRQSRTIKVSYVIKGGAPRSAAPVRVMHAYASFCVVPNGYDSGSVTVRAPTTYLFTTTGTSMSSTVSGTTRIYRSGKVTDTASYWTCFDGVDYTGYRVQPLSMPNGVTIILESWPEDPLWRDTVQTDIEHGLPALADLIGKPLKPYTQLTVLEAVTGSEYAGFYYEQTRTITVDENFDQPSLVQHELAHAWFNGALFDDQWLSEGSAEWAARAVAGDQPACTQPSATSGSIDLSHWLTLNPRSTEAEREAVANEYDAACYVVTQAADAAGADGMATALTALIDGRDPYALDPSTKRLGTLATWKDWLDAVDELALTPEGASEASLTDLLIQYGVANDRGLLDERATARAAYHDLEVEVGDWVVPEAIRAPLTAWNFTQAEAAVQAAEPTWQLTGEADAALAGIDARHGPAAEAWAAARDKADLDAAAKLAQQQLDAARDVASTLTLADQPLDLVQQVGLLGSTLPDAHPAVAAVRDGDFSRASEITASVRDAIAALHDTGQTRLTVAALVVAAVLLLLVIVLVLWMRSRRRRRLALATAAATAAIGAAPGAVPGTAPEAVPGTAPEAVPPTALDSGSGAAMTLGASEGAPTALGAPPLPPVRMADAPPPPPPPVPTAAAPPPPPAPAMPSGEAKTDDETRQPTEAPPPEGPPT